MPKEQAHDQSWATDFDDAISGGTAKEVGILAGSAIATSALLSGIAGYRNAADPTKGMPAWKIGLDAAVGLLGIGGAIFAGDALGETGSLVVLGAGLAGACSVGSHYGTVAGADLYKSMQAGKSPANPPANPPAAKGLHEGGVGSMSAETRARYEAYMGR